MNARVHVFFYLSVYVLLLVPAKFIPVDVKIGSFKSFTQLSIRISSKISH